MKNCLPNSRTNFSSTFSLYWLVRVTLYSFNSRKAFSLASKRDSMEVKRCSALTVLSLPMVSKYSSISRLSYASATLIYTYFSFHVELAQLTIEVLQTMFHFIATTNITDISSLSKSLFVVKLLITDGNKSYISKLDCVLTTNLIKEIMKSSFMDQHIDISHIAGTNPLE